MAGWQTAIPPFQFSVFSATLITPSLVFPDKTPVGVTLLKEKPITCDLTLSMVFCWEWKKRM